MTDQKRQADLGAALNAHYKPAAEAKAAEQQAYTDRAKDDAGLYGTAGWDLLPLNRQHAARQHTLNAASKTTKETPDAAA